MRLIALWLGVVGSVGAMALGSRAISEDRTASSGPSPIVHTSRADPAASSVADKVWYGGTLPPIVVVAERPQRIRARVARAARDCPGGG